MNRNTEMIVRRSTMVYQDISDYINDNIVFDSLVVSNFRSIFSIYFSLMTIYFACFASQKLMKKLVKLGKLRLKQTLRRFLRPNQVDDSNIVCETIELND